MPGQIAVNLSLEERCARDSQNGHDARYAAELEIHKIDAPNVQVDFARGAVQGVSRLQHYQARLGALKSILRSPFQAMVEIIRKSEDGNEDSTGEVTLWYANEKTEITQIFELPEKRIIVLPWTHPAIQVGLSESLGEFHDLDPSPYKIASIKPIARAKFTQVLPLLFGLYEPGGRTEAAPERQPPVTGLRAVRLDMTPEQVRAFISRMDGMMLVTGAPGSGKTTVALQRIRFLFNQKYELSDLKVVYSPEATRVFLANDNLIAYSRNLLVEELDVPASVVEYVPQFITGYIESLWLYKHRARPRMRHIHTLEERARRAFWGLCTSKDLRGLWLCYERQIADRFSQTPQAVWYLTDQLPQNNSGETLSVLVQAFVSAAKRSSVSDPLKSELRMGAIYRKVRKNYEAVRDSIAQSARDRFDVAFQQWLFWVYDPFEALRSYFREKTYDGQIRIRNGTGARLNDEDVVAAIMKELDDRQYGPEMEAWLTWILRFALPEDTSPTDRFRLIPCVFTAWQGIPEGRLTHVVIDEAQDLSVPEASLLASLVHPNGALTVSADFRQVVSPVHGMTDLSAFQIGNRFQEREAFERFPFARNMRQSRQIGKFLEAFYQAMFGEVPPFDTGERFSDAKPWLLISKQAEFAFQIRRIQSVLRRSKSVATIALMQINEDEVALGRLRSALEGEGLSLAPIWKPSDEQGRLITTSVERIKGLEYDACIVLGLDDTERAALNFTKNRAYVALSRACRRLVMLCEEFPAALQTVRRDLFEVIQTESK